MDGIVVRPGKRRSEDGASAVEFALIVVPLITILVGIVQASLFMWAYQVGSHAAGEGARRYAVDPCVDHTAIVKDRIGTDPAGISVGTSFSASPKKVGDTVTVTVTYPVEQVAGGLIPGIPTTMTRTSSARIEDVTGC